MHHRRHRAAWGHVPRPWQYQRGAVVDASTSLGMKSRMCRSAYVARASFV